VNPSGCSSAPSPLETFQTGQLGFGANLRLGRGVGRGVDPRPRGIDRSNRSLARAAYRSSGRQELTLAKLRLLATTRTHIDCRRGASRGLRAVGWKGGRAEGRKGGWVEKAAARMYAEAVGALVPVTDSFLCMDFRQPEPDRIPAVAWNWLGSFAF
jgi:hypothetical protein